MLQISAVISSFIVTFVKQNLKSFKKFMLLNYNDFNFSYSVIYANIIIQEIW